MVVSKSIYQVVFLDGYLQDENGDNSTWDASYIMYELQILHDYTISNVNYHKPKSLNIQADDRVNLIVSDKVTENGGALIYRNKVPAFIFEHEIILKHS